MIFGGVDKTGCRLFTTDPSGSYKGYMATALGRKSEEAIAVLDKEYRDNLSLQESLDLALRTVKTASETEVTSKVIKAAVIPAQTRLFRRLTNEEIDSRLAHS
jgi:proteasome alpha subunit